MKYRLVELLQCPNHPGEFPRLSNVRISEMFPDIGCLQEPVCRSGCSYLGNWFTEIPDSLPRHHRIDCRRCLGTEIEEGTLGCPVCDWSVPIIDGVLQPGKAVSSISIPFEVKIENKSTISIDKHIDLQPGEIVLLLTGIDDRVQEKWCENGIERIHVGLSLPHLHECRARDCALGHGLAHHILGPLDISIIRESTADAILLTVPSETVVDSDHAVSIVPSLIKKSGRALLLYESGGRVSGSIVERHDKLIASFPGNISGFRTKLMEIPGYDLLVIEHPHAENGSHAVKSVSKTRPH